jgi:hypothetical protein
MKNSFFGLLAGLALGAAVAALLMRRPAGSTPIAADPPAAEVTESALQLHPDQQAKAGFVVAAPKVVELQPETKAYGRVLDPMPLAAALAEIESAESTLAASTKALARAQTLQADGDNVSRQTVETARAAESRDRIQAVSARARLLAGWGPAVAARTDLPALVEALVMQKSALARLDLLADETSSLPPSLVRVSPLAGGSTPQTAELLGPAPSADPQVQGAAYFALLREQPLPAGTTLVAYLAHAGPAQKTVTVPRSAVIYHEGSSWIYVLGEKDTFHRRRIQLGLALADGFAVTEGLSEKERVLVVGAQQLLSNELQAAGGGGPD